MFGGFSGDYLIDGVDVPCWVNGNGDECAGPQDRLKDRLPNSGQLEFKTCFKHA